MIARLVFFAALVVHAFAQVESSEWTIRPTPAVANLWGVAAGSVASGPTRFVAVGEQGTILYSIDQGESWLAANSGTTEWLTAAVFSNGLFYVVGGGGMVLTSSDGVIWTREPTPVTTRLNGVLGSGAPWSAIAVGEAGTILLRDATGIWTRLESGFTDRWLRGVGRNLVGQGGLILEWSNVPSVTLTPSPTPHDVEAIVSGPLSLTIAVGANGTILRQEASTWIAQPSGTNERLRGISYKSGGMVSLITRGFIQTFGEFFAVGTNGTILRSSSRSTEKWEADPSPTTRHLNAVTTGNPYVVAVGDAGTIIRIGGPGLSPVITSQPTFGYEMEGQPYMEAMASGSGALTYQWTQVGGGVPYPVGANQRRERVTTQFSHGTRIYQLIVANAFGLVASDPVVPHRFLNLSSRAPVGAGENILIGGFVVGGFSPTSRQFLVRAVGPGLSAAGVTNPLAAPVLKIYQGQAEIASNRGWETAPNAAALATAAAQVRTFPLRPGSADSALLISLADGSYTAHVESGDGTAGIALLEVYDVDPPPHLDHLTNVSARARVQPGEGVLIGGLVIEGPLKKKVLLRAAGPALLPQGIQQPLGHPRLVVYRGQEPLFQGENWSAAANASALRAAAVSAGAFAFPEGSADAALIAELEPGPYTVMVSDVNGAEGVALVEIYELP